MSASKALVVLFTVVTLVVAALPAKGLSGEVTGVVVGRELTPPPRSLVAFERGPRPAPGPYGGYGDPYYSGRYDYRYREEQKSPYENLQIRPAGELLIQVVPSHAQVWVDGYEVKQGADASFSIGLLTGTHQVQVQAEGYKPYLEDVVIDAAKRTVLSVELKR
jgi:hypothetical protein